MFGSHESPSWSDEFKEIQVAASVIISNRVSQHWFCRNDGSIKPTLEILYHYFDLFRWIWWLYRIQKKHPNAESLQWPFASASPLGVLAGCEGQRPNRTGYGSVAAEKKTVGCSVGLERSNFLQEVGNGLRRVLDWINGSKFGTNLNSLGICCFKNFRFGKDLFLEVVFSCFFPLRRFLHELFDPIFFGQKICIPQAVFSRKLPRHKTKSAKYHKMQHL